MDQDQSSLFNFMFLLGKLKTTKRTGWLQKNIANPESISDHMYRMAILSMLLPEDSSISKDRCIKLCLVHDMAESIVGDITPLDGIPENKKHEMEEKAMKSIENMIGGRIGEEFFNLWKEYEENMTAESKFVKNLDKFEMILQAHEYEMEHQLPIQNLQPFFDSTEGKFNDKMVTSWVNELHTMRNMYAASNSCIYKGLI